jgi:hypothetical protein
MIITDYDFCTCYEGQFVVGPLFTFHYSLSTALFTYVYKHLSSSSRSVAEVGTAY